MRINKNFQSDIAINLDDNSGSGGTAIRFKINGTTLLFKEADLDVRDMEMELPDAPDYLGDDGRDYEGSKARSQMLKMKRYIIALGQMIDDETELEAWVQAKLTKASDYMSSVYHYLDYQRMKYE